MGSVLCKEKCKALWKHTQGKLCLGNWERLYVQDNKWVEYWRMNRSFPGRGVTDRGKKILKSMDWWVMIVPQEMGIDSKLHFKFQKIEICTLENFN